MAGPVIHQLGQERAGVRLVWLKSADSPKIDKDVSTLTFKRAAFWHNTNRNDQVAAVARAFADQDAEKLSEYGVLMRGGRLLLRHAPDTKIAVLVASTEQAREVSKRLPGWNVVHLAPTKAGKGTQGTKMVQQEPKGTIISEAAAGKQVLEADVVIRAGGSMGRMCFKDFPPVLDKDKRDVILVDFIDGFDQRAAQESNRRRREYELLGWEGEPAHGNSKRRSR